MPKSNASKTAQPMTPARAAEVLTQYNLWRKGKGKFSWNGQSRTVPPSFFEAFPIRDIDAAIELAIKTLKAKQKEAK